MLVVHAYISILREREYTERCGVCSDHPDISDLHVALQDIAMHRMGIQVEDEFEMLQVPGHR